MAANIEVPRIVHVAGTRNTEYVLLKCTGCNEYYSYSVRQYKGDFGCNISEFEHFLSWAKWDAARHECFLAGRDVYMPPETPTELERHASQPDFPQVETREEDPWGGVGYVVEPEEDEEWYEPDDLDDDDWDDELDAWMDEELDLPPYSPLDAAKTLDFQRFYEMMGPEVYHEDEEEPFGDNYDWDENRFSFLYDRSNVAALIALGLLTGTGRKRSEPEFIFEIREMPRKFEGEMVYIEFDYAELEQRVVDEELLRAGVYSLDNHGCLRDEKGRCLACLRPGPHFPFYYERDKR